MVPFLDPTVKQAIGLYHTMLMVTSTVQKEFSLEVFLSRKIKFYLTGNLNAFRVCTK